MADEKFNIEVAVNAQLESLNKIQDALGELNKKLGIVSDSTSNLNNVCTGAMMNIGAQISNLALKFPNLATAAIQAFGQQEMAVQKLAAAIRSQGGDVSEVLPIMQQFASEMQAITTYGDEQVLAMQSVATAMGVSADQMDLCIQGAIGLTNVYGIGLNEAIRASASVVQGKTEKLNELIPVLSKCKSETEKYALAEKAMKDGFAQAEAAANTLDGKLKQAANAWGDLQEVVGEAFAPTVKTVAELIKGICGLMTEHSVVAKTLTTALASLAVGFAFTKIGGLANVAKMFLGISSATKAATTAMYGLNLAIKANPIGIIASLATGAILGLSQLIDYVSNLESEEEKEAAAQEAAAEARRKAAADASAASAALDEYANAIARESETASDTALRISALSAEIEKLSDRSKWGENEQEASAQKLVEKKKELLEIQKVYLDKVKASAEVEYQYASNRETERKYRVERELNAARETGIAHIIKFKEAELKHVEELQKSVEIQKKYYADHAHLVKSEEDRKRIMADAKAYAEMSLKNMRDENRQAEQRASTEKWLAAEVEGDKTVQRGLEMDILRARASGNEALAKEIEGKLRVSQLASEIFDNTRKEGMSRKELESLMETARGQAQERYKLEKSVSDEIERQNLAKDAQAKIEDIILTNKIEQLKAQGKMKEAQTLSDERDIKRTMAGLKGVSDEDKNKLAQMMRQTNAYKEKQQLKDSKNQFQSPSLNISGISSVKTPASTKIPATVSEKYRDAYNEWKSARNNGETTQSWTAFRNSRNTQNTQNSQSDTKRLQSYAASYLERTNNSARKISFGGDIRDAIKKDANIPNTARQIKNENNPTNNRSISSALKKRGVDTDVNNNSEKDINKMIEEIKKLSEDSKKILSNIENTTKAIATTKKR